MPRPAQIARLVFVLVSRAIKWPAEDPIVERDGAPVEPLFNGAFGVPQGPTGVHGLSFLREQVYVNSKKYAWYVLFLEPTPGNSGSLFTTGDIYAVRPASKDTAHLSAIIPIEPFLRSRRRAVPLPNVTSVAPHGVRGGSIQNVNATITIKKTIAPSWR